LLGAFSEWLSEHPTMIGCVLPVLIRGLHDASLAQSASMSLKDLVRECQLQLHPHAKDILTNIQVCELCSCRNVVTLLFTRIFVQFCS
jgi:hypothetical protein